MPADSLRAHEMPRRRVNVPGLTDRLGVDVKQDTDCKVCGGEAWDDAPISLCRACMIRAATFVAEERDRYFDLLAQDEMARTFVPDVAQVYYLRWGDRIKIGASICPAKRALALSLDPANIVATEPGGFSVERMRHHEFADLRLEGEWFIAGDDLLAHIRSLAVA